MVRFRDIHGAHVHKRRVDVLARDVAPLLPANASIVDIGAGDGRLAERVTAARPDLKWMGVDTVSRPTTHVPVQLFNGEQLPFPDKSFDTALFIDVLHHTLDPMVLLREALRVARHSIVIKDHMREGFLAGPTLRLMDWVGNAGWGVRLPYNYWNQLQWERACIELRLDREFVQQDLRLYPWWADWYFGRSLHFLARLKIQSRSGA